MLSKISVLFLGLLAERSLNPYEIVKLLEKVNIQKWFPISTSSVHATIKNLLKKNYITGISAKEKNRPEKVIYSITNDGENIFLKSLEQYLEEIEIQTGMMDIVIFLLCHLDKNKVLTLLQKKLEVYGQKEKILKEKINSLNAQIPHISVMLIKRPLYHIQAEVNLIRELISVIQKDDSWNHFPLIDLMPK